MDSIETKDVTPSNLTLTDCVSMSSSNAAYPASSESTKTNRHPRVFFDRTTTNIEPHQLVWLRMDSYNTNEPISKFRAIIDYVKLFDDVTECQNFIEKTNDTQTFLILSFDQLMQDYIPLFHEYNQIKSIYIFYQMEQDFHPDLISNFKKIKRTYNCSKDLLIELSKDVNNYLKHEQDYGLLTYTGDEQTTSFNDKSWWQYIIDFLVSIDYPKDYKQLLINDLTVYYDGNDHELSILQEFQRTYTPEKAICWYTRPTFFYRLINKALRQRDVPVVFRFGFFLKDLYQQLKQLHDEHRKSLSSIIRCYRGQIMSADERDRIIKSSILRIQTNSLLSASCDRDISLLFLQTDNYEVDSILFEIELNTKYLSYPYANIKNLSYIPDEEEILFSVGTVFEAEPKNAYYDEKVNIWFIKLILCDYENILNENFHEENKINGEKNRLKHQLNKLVKLTYRWTYDDLNNVFQQIMNLFSADQWISAIMYKALGKRDLHTPIYSRTYDPDDLNDSELYARAIKNYENSIQIWQIYELNKELDSYFEIAKLYRCIIQVCRVILDHQLEEKYIQLAMEYNCIAIRQAKKSKNYRQLAEIYENCARTYFEKNSRASSFHLECCPKSFHLAIKYSKKERDVLMKYVSRTTTTLADCYFRIAEIYDDVWIYHRHRKFKFTSFIYYKKALKIYLMQPSSKTNASHISDTSSLIAHRCDLRKTKNYNLVLKYQLISTKYTIIANTPIKMYHIETTNIVKSYQELAQCYERVNQYDSAIDTLLLAIETYEKNQEEFSEEINRQRIEQIKTDIKLMQLKAQVRWKYNSKKTPPRLPSPDLIKDENSQDNSSYIIEIFDDKTKNDTSKYIEISNVPSSPKIKEETTIFDLK